MSLIHVFAQAAIAAAPQPAPPQALAAPAPATQDISSYPASFFEGQQVANAYEMLGRAPGFTLDLGDDVRGFEGAAGNVLVDGQRPTSKTDTLDQILTRIPVGQIERIDIIRGGAPGIDMQGNGVVANVILKKGAVR